MDLTVGKEGNEEGQILLAEGRALFVEFLDLQSCHGVLSLDEAEALTQLRAVSARDQARSR